MKQSIGDHIEVMITLENGEVTFIVDKISNHSGNVQVVSNNVTLTEGDLLKIKQEIAELKQLTHLKNNRYLMGLRYLEHLTRGFPGYVIPDRNKPYHIVNVYNETENSDEEETESIGPNRFLLPMNPTNERTRLPTGPTTRRPTRIPTAPTPPTTRRPTTAAPTYRCGDYFLSTWKSSPYAGAPCPKYTTIPIKDTSTTITCLCPYHGTSPKTAIIDGRNRAGVLKTVSWRVKYGSATKDCIGRCGPTCNDADREATMDCLEHDLCINLFGGPLTFGNKNCANEVSNAVDDVAATFVSICC
jgi:hypothetical protein